MYIEFPKWQYSALMPHGIIVHTPEELQMLEGQWFDSPALIPLDVVETVAPLLAIAQQINDAAVPVDYSPDKIDKRTKEYRESQK